MSLPNKRIKFEQASLRNFFQQPFTSPIKEKVVDKADCPICASSVPLASIEAHVNTCLDKGGDSSPATITEESVIISPAPVTSTPSTPAMFPITSLATLSSSSTITAPISTPAPTAFSILMKPHSESKQWALADAVTSSNLKGKARSRPEARTAPFYKILQGMPISVDAFRFGRIQGCSAYFLTHFHSDHYGGLNASWKHGPVYCSFTSANLCKSSLKVDEKWLRPLQMEVPTLIPDSGGVTVTCIEANHCPGSCLFLFEGPTRTTRGKTHRYLHCGDFRASPVHTNHPLIKGKKLDIIYLDTTYCNPRYCFPAQDQVVDACAELVRQCMPKAQNKVEEDQEDWRMPVNTRCLEQNSKEAVAFKGWLGGFKEQEEPLLEDEDAVMRRRGKWVDEVDMKEEDEKVPPVEVESIKPDDPLLQTDIKPNWLSKPLSRRGRLLVVIGTYTIGKEKIVKAVARVLHSKVFCLDSRKYTVYTQLEDAELHSMLTRNPSNASVHVTNLHSINAEGLRDILAALRTRGCDFTHVLAFRPTGWTYKPPQGIDMIAPALDQLIQWNQARTFGPSGLFPTRDSTPEYMIYGVPYSEHSSFFELTAFALGTDYDRIIATVNVGSATSRNKMHRWFEKWKEERRRRDKMHGKGNWAVEPRALTYW